MSKTVFRRSLFGGVKWSRPCERLRDCPPPPEGAQRVDAGYKGYELIDVGRERWRFQHGYPVAYFLYTSDKSDPSAPWEAVWLEEGYQG